MTGHNIACLASLVDRPTNAALARPTQDKSGHEGSQDYPVGKSHIPLRGTEIYPQEKIWHEK